MSAIAAGIGAAGSILGGITGGKGASAAAKAQAQAQEQQLQLASNEFNTISNDASPNINAGDAATQQLLRMLGLGDSNTGVSVNGNPAQSAAQQQAGALAGITSSPLYTDQYNSGLQAVDQSLAASGGLRGGDGALAQSTYGSNLFNQIYQQQIGNLGSVAGIGQSALGTLSGAGSSYVNASGTANTALGNANATSAAAPYAAFQQILSGLGSSGALSGGSGTSDLGDYAAYGW